MIQSDPTDPTTGAVAAVHSCDGSILAVGDLRLHYRTWEAPAPRAAIVFVHGIGEHGGRYAYFGRRMATFGISTFALDLRGHGLSEGRRGHVHSFDVFLQDVDRFRREVDGIVNGTSARRVPIFLIGHSMGGLIALRYQQEYSTCTAGCVLIAPWLATAMPMPRVKAAAAGVLSKLVPALPLRTGLDPDHLSRDPSVVEDYRADPLVHDRITPRLFSEASDAISLALQRGDRIQRPLLFMLPGDDRIVETDRTVRFSRSITGADVTMHVQPGAYHDLLHEIDQPGIHRTIADWILAEVG